MKNIITSAIQSSIRTKTALLSAEFVDKIAAIADTIYKSVLGNGKVIVFGNGGSAADAQHMAAELVGRFKKERRAIPAICLTTNTSSLTAISNDYSYRVSFKRQLEAFANSSDIVIGISTSGNAENVIEAVNFANEKGIKTVALTGKDGGKLAKISGLSLIVPSSDTPCIQESHILVIHILCALIEEKID